MFSNLLDNEQSSCVVSHRKHRRTHSAALGQSSNSSMTKNSSDENMPSYTILDDSAILEKSHLTPTNSSVLNRRCSSYSGELFSNATRELSEVASRVVEHAEDLVKQIWEQGWRVVHRTSLPYWLRDNEYLIWGHRPQLTSVKDCFKSIFRIHTETGNIWTHLIGFVCFLILCISFIIHPGLKLPLMEKAIISIFFASAILALGFSWLFHTLYCHSEHVGKIFNKLDYVGIALLTMGSFVPWLHYSFYCHVPSKIIYMCCILILGVICIIISTKDTFRTPNYRGVRAALFVALGLSGVIPCMHYIFMEGFWDTVSSAAVGWLFLMAFLYITGAFIYASRFPERFYPGKFDIWFQSHQIFHVFVVLAALVHLNSILEIAESRISKGSCNHP